MNHTYAKWRIWLALASWLFYISAIIIPQATSAAADFNYDTTVTYHVNSDNTTDVTENYTVTNNTPRQYLTGLKLITPTDSVAGLSVKYNDGTAIPATTSKQTGARGEIHFNYQQIDINFPRQTYGAGKSWKFSVNFRATGLVDTKGSSHTIYVPSIEPSDAGDSYNVTVDVPADFGNPHFAGAKSASGGVTDGRQFYNFTKDDLVAHSLALSFGDSTIYHLNFNFPLSNDGALSKTMTVTLPPDLNNQKSYVDSLNPAPIDTRLDEDGNVLADYHLKPHQQITVTTDISGQVKYLEYDLSASGKKADIPADLVSKYTKPTHYWTADSTVTSEAKKVTDPNAPVINNVQAIYKDVVAKLSYNDNKIKFNIRQGATAALANPTNAVCLEYADLTIAMLRSVGIPARMPVGYGYSGSLKASPAVDDSLHAWVEAYVPGIGWMTLDPTWGEKFDQFGKSDLDHFAFAVWGEQDSTPTAVMAGTTDLNYQYEQAKLDYRSSVVAVANTGVVTGHRYTLLPFLALDRVSLTAQAQVASDNNQLHIGPLTIPLGSLAPSQHTTINRWVIGGDWNKSAELKLSRNSSGQALVLASAKLQPDYSTLPAVPILILVVAGLLIMVRLRSGNRLQITEVHDHS